MVIKWENIAIFWIDLYTTSLTILFSKINFFYITNEDVSVFNKLTQLFATKVISTLIVHTPIKTYISSAFFVWTVHIRWATSCLNCSHI